MKIIFDNVSSFELTPFNYREAKLKFKVPVINPDPFGDGELEIDLRKCALDINGNEIIVKEIYSV